MGKADHFSTILETQLILIEGSVRMNIANKITIARILMIPLFVVLLLHGRGTLSPLWAALVFVTASSTDKLDGMIARKFDMITTFGKFLDPLADKLLVVSAIICLTYLGICSPYVGIIITARELIVTAFRAVAMGQGVVLAADNWGKAKTFVQNVAVSVVLGSLVWPELELMGFWLLWAAAVITIYSGYRYLATHWHLIGDDW